jgi:hypothetical protein
MLWGSYLKRAEKESTPGAAVTKTKGQGVGPPLRRKARAFRGMMTGAKVKRG